MSRAAPRLRPAAPDDLAEIRSLLAEHGNDGPHPVHDVVGPYVRHLIATGHTFVADGGDRIDAFGATVDTGRGGRHLTDLFVRSDLLGQGIGRPLLGAVFADAWPRTTFASDDPRALPLYVRAGMIPLWPLLYASGPVEAIPEGDPGVRAESAEPARLAELERSWTGAERPLDHAFWASQADADAFVLLAGDEVVAVGCGRARQRGSERAVDRLLIKPGTEPLGPIYAALRRVARDGRVMACLPGPNPAVRPLLDAGFKVDDRDTFMTSAPDLVDPARLLPNPGML